MSQLRANASVGLQGWEPRQSSTTSARQWCLCPVIRQEMDRNDQSVCLCCIASFWLCLHEADCPVFAAPARIASERAFSNERMWKSCSKKKNQFFWGAMSILMDKGIASWSRGKTTLPSLLQANSNERACALARTHFQYQRFIHWVLYSVTTSQPGGLSGFSACNKLYIGDDECCEVLTTRLFLNTLHQPFLA